MSDVQPRITGTEMEWPVQVRTESDDYFRAIKDKEANAALYSDDPRLQREHNNGMLSNGARYYLDVGSNLEYATPEDTSIMGTVAREFAGENVVYDSLMRAKDAGSFLDFYMTKRVIDDKNNTCGYHINLSANAARVPINNAGLATLGIHLATMNVFAGAGAVIRRDNKTTFTVAQKSLTLTGDFASNSHGVANPLLSVRDESLSEKKYSRVHITSMDANMSPWSTWMTLGTASIVLRMMEHGYLKPERYFAEDMYKVGRMVAFDSSLSAAFEREKGGTITALDTQGLLMMRAKEFNKEGLLAREEQQVLHEWERILLDLQIDPELTEDRVEWVARKALIERYMARHALKLSSDKVKKFDLAWSTIGPDTIGSRYRQRVWSKWMPDRMISAAYDHPPSTTRALGRSALIRQYAGSLEDEFFCDWDEASLANQNKTWLFPDPYSTAIPEEASKH